MSATAVDGAHLAALRGRVDGLRIGIVHYDEHVPLDESYRPGRMGQLAGWLTEAGAAVTRFAPSYSLGADRQRPLAWTGAETVEGSLQVIPTRTFESSRGRARFDSLRDFVSGTAAALLASDPFDVLVAGYPPPGVVTAARRATGDQVPILADIRDLWPDALFHRPSPTIARAASAAGRLMTQELRQATGVVAMSQTMLARAPLSSRRCAIPLSIPESSDSYAPAVDSDDGLRAVFVGVLSEASDLDSVIRGWDRYSSQRSSCSPPPRLEIYGTGRTEAELRSMASSIDTIEMGGWLPSVDVPAVLSAADVGVAPTQPGFGTTLSNKVLEYLGAGAFIVNSLESESASALAEQCFGMHVRATADGWASGFLDVEHDLARIRAERPARKAAAVGSYGRANIELQWLEQITGAAGR